MLKFCADASRLHIAPLPYLYKELKQAILAFDDLSHLIDRYRTYIRN